MRLLILTGGSRGIGRAVADAFAGEGFAIIEFSRTAPHPYSVRTDLTDPLAAHRNFRDALAHVKPQGLEELIALSNAATLEPIGPAHRKAPEAVIGNVEVNFTSAVLFMSAVVSQFQDSDCRKVIANVSAGAARNGGYGWSLYCAAKVAMDNFVSSLAAEQQAQARPFIAVNVDPGVVDTDMHAVAASASPTDFPAAAKFATRRAQGCLTPPSRAGRAIAKLLRSSGLSPGHTYDARDVEL